MVLTLNNSSLTVELVDPRQDAHLLGARYCHGGYIFQVTDSAVGELLTGPAGAVHEAGNTFDVFNGQGFPDSFNQIPLTAQGPSAGGEGQGLVIGTGLIDRDHTPASDAAERNPTGAGEGVLEYCQWAVEQ